MPGPDQGQQTSAKHVGGGGQPWGAFRQRDGCVCPGGREKEGTAVSSREHVPVQGARRARGCVCVGGSRRWQRRDREARGRGVGRRSGESWEAGVMRRPWLQTAKELALSFPAPPSPAEMPIFLEIIPDNSGMNSSNEKQPNINISGNQVS